MASLSLPVTLLIVAAVSPETWAETPLSARQPWRPSPSSSPPPCSFEPRCQVGAGRVLVPDPCRCQAYFECADGGRATRRLCKPWQNFDPVALRCVWFDEVDCSWPQRATTTSLPTTTPTSTSLPTTTPTSTSLPTTTPTSTTAPPMPTPVPGCAYVPEPCPSAGSSRQAIPCDGYCDKYIECSEGGAMAVRKCWWLWAFDHASLACKLYPWVDCAWFH